MAATIATQAEFEAEFGRHISDMRSLSPNMSYAQSVDRLRQMLRSGILRHTDIERNPQRFLAAHRLLAELATRLGPGFWIRFTVHFNLFAGTVMALGSPEQVALLDKFQSEGKVGCFGLTEAFAGVNSGMIVNTTATWSPEKQMFLIQCPDRGAYKNWISQGLVADMCVVMATLHVGGKSLGPHAFLMELRKGGKLADGVTMGDMGAKSVGNDLDNAWICFENVWLPKDSLLSRYSYVEGNEHHLRQKGIRTIDMIGQRLYTGRAVISRAAVVFTRTLYANTRAYTDGKKCWAPKGAELTLSGVPQLRALFGEADASLSHLERFIGEVERRLADCLASHTMPPADLVEAIAAAKVKSVELGIELCWRLKQEVGSYALMAGSGFEQIDFLQCCKFAEGDSRILMLKMSRDRVRAFQQGAAVPAAEADCCRRILEAAEKGDAMREHEIVYELAANIISRTVDGFAGAAAKL